jgi:RsiW-degrading membrane proteinase PrsW (M82 family)
LPPFSFSSLLPVRHWARDPALRSWPVLLLIVLTVVPPFVLVLLSNGTEGDLHAAAWIFAYYFAVAWMLLLGVIVRPQHVTRAMLATVAGVGIVTQVPIALALEARLHSSTGNLFASIFTIGIPEELAKAIPIVVVAWIWRRNWQSQTPRDYLFLGAVSGLVFGAAEVVHYFDSVLGNVTGNFTDADLQFLTIEYVWRFLTDPISHACWAGITGYFIGLAITGPVRRYWIAFIGIGIAAVLHGLNDWVPINGHTAWVLMTLISVLLFLGYARAGAELPVPQPVPGHSPAAPAVAQTRREPWSPGPATPPAAAAYDMTRTALRGEAAGVSGAGGAGGPVPSAPGGQPVPHPAPQPAWWRAAPGTTQPAPPGQPAYPPAAQPAATQQRAAPRPWWEQ